MKPTILTTIRYYLPGCKSGGPVRTLSNMVERLGDEFGFRLVTSDRDALETQAYSDVEVDKWNRIGKAQVFYASPVWQQLGRLAVLLRETPHDLLYLNSFFNPTFTLQPLLLRHLRLVPRKPVVIAPRGEFSPGHLDLHRWKYVPYTKVVKALGVYRELVWQASSNREQGDIRREMGSVAATIRIAPDLIDSLSEPVNYTSVRNNVSSPLKVLFLSRISRMKNLDYALGLLRNVSCEVVFGIYGVIDDRKYWEECRIIIQDLPENVSVEYKGEVPHSEVPFVFSASDIFLFPTRGENFGHVIHEALAAGVPVLLSDTTPWQDVEDAGVGWVRSLSDEKGFSDVIEEFSRMEPRLRKAQRMLAAEYAARVSNNETVIESNKKLFTNWFGDAISGN